jgi:hypothetical protein
MEKPTTKGVSIDELEELKVADRACDIILTCNLHAFLFSMLMLERNKKKSTKSAEIAEPATSNLLVGASLVRQEYLNPKPWVALNFIIIMSLSIITHI